jgi:hypothetical protein
VLTTCIEIRDITLELPERCRQLTAFAVVFRRRVPPMCPLCFRLILKGRHPRWRLPRRERLPRTSERGPFWIRRILKPISHIWMARTGTAGSIPTVKAFSIAGQPAGAEICVTKRSERIHRSVRRGGRGV